MTISSAERDVMEHACAFRHARPFYRNHFVTSPECDNWETLQGLCRRGLMRVSREPSELSGGGHVFSVTDSGRAELGCVE